MVSTPKVEIVEDPATQTPEASEAVDMTADLKKKELIEAIVARSELKKGVTRETLDVAFAVMAEALDAGRGLNIPPLGKVTINRERQNAAGDKVLIAKVRIASKTSETSAEPAAE